jgi:hypothetical protein
VYAEGGRGVRTKGQAVLDGAPSLLSVLSDMGMSSATTATPSAPSVTALPTRREKIAIARYNSNSLYFPGLCQSTGSTRAPSPVGR